MKKILSVILCAVILSTCFACGGKVGDKNVTLSAEQDSPYFGSYYLENPDGIPKDAVNMIQDEKYQYGINIVTPTTGTRALTGNLDYEVKARFLGDDKPGGEAWEYLNRTRFWSIAQWTSKGDIGAESNRTLTKNGNNYIYENDYKKIIVNPTDGILTLRANAGKEYDYAERPESMREKGEWTHLLIEQYTNARYYNLECVKDAYVYLDFSLDEVRNYNVSAAFAEGQKAQLVWYFALNLAGYKPTWFGIPLYDSSEANSMVKGEVYTHDPGMDYPLYAMAQDEIFDSQIQVGTRYKKAVRITDFLKYCFTLGLKRGVYDENAKFEECTFWNMNLGFEIPGTFDAQVTFYRIGLYYVFK